MRKIMFALALLIPLFIGCSDSIVNPKTASQVDNSNQTDNTDQTDSTNQIAYKKSWIKLPENPGMVADSEYSASKVIDGETGGIVELNINYVTKGSVNVLIDAFIEVPSGAYSGEKNIQMIINSNTGTAIFYPSPETFNKPLIFNLKINGVDLNGVDKKKLDYVYLAPDDSFQRIEYKKLVINDGVLIVEDAQIPHFSIYGWCR
ncbi:MAG: hypothetical protein WAM24_19175 [Ignavibacteriaceae bacterium]